MYARGESRAENCCRQTTKPSSLAYSLQTAPSVCDTHFRTSCLGPAIPRPAGMDPGLALMIASVFKVATRVRHMVAATAVAASLLGGCAVNDTGASEVWDPIETPNRFIFSINRAVDVMAVRPVAVALPLGPDIRAPRDVVEVRAHELLPEYCRRRSRLRRIRHHR